jgi:hypothetical protein
MLFTMSYTHTEESLREAAQAAVGGCLRCLQEFPDICQGDLMINFSVPTRIGFGIARGTACCLRSGDRILDYSGHLLNLTSRLLDLARPSGVVLDGDFGLDLLPEEQQGLFEKADVYLPGVAEETPTPAYILKDVVELPEAACHPLRLEQWERIEEVKTVREWSLASPRYGVDLKRRLKRIDGIQVAMAFPLFRGGKRVVGLLEQLPAAFDYVVRANQPTVVLHVGKIVDFARERKVPWTEKVSVVIDYVPG